MHKFILLPLFYYVILYYQLFHCLSLVTVFFLDGVFCPELIQMSGIIITDQYMSIKISQKKEKEKKRGNSFYGKKTIHLNYFIRIKRRKQGIH
jgi:hypothetical protein